MRVGCRECFFGVVFNGLIEVFFLARIFTLDTPRIEEGSRSSPTEAADPLAEFYPLAKAELDAVVSLLSFCHRCAVLST
jgi:hypothetical protein